VPSLRCECTSNHAGSREATRVLSVAVGTCEVVEGRQQQLCRSGSHQSGSTHQVPSSPLVELCGRDAGLVVDGPAHNGRVCSQGGIQGQGDSSSCKQQQGSVVCLLQQYQG
jgi:hypothetical protein